MKRSRKAIGIHIVTGTREVLGITPEDKFYYPTVQEFGDKVRGIPGRHDMRRAYLQQRKNAVKAIAKTLGKKQDEIVRKMKKVR